MRRLAQALAALALLAGVAAIDGGGGVAAPLVARPNVIVLLTDDQQLESLRVMANVRRLLGERGITFDSSFVSLSLCCPSRATFLTGQYAHNHGVRTNTPPRGGYPALDGSRTLAVWLRRAGYATVHLGQYLNGYGETRPREIPPGWSEWHGTPDPDAKFYFGFRLNENGSLRRYGKGPGSYQTDVYARKAVEIVGRRARSVRPYFLWVAFLAPHAASSRSVPVKGPFGFPQVAPRHRGRFAREPLPRLPSFNEADVSDKSAEMRSRPPLAADLVQEVEKLYRRRLESLLAVDEAVGRIVRAVERSGEAANTLILFTSDNGYFQGEHRISHGKIFPYEPSIRVPLLVRGPGVPAGQRLPQLVWNGDLAPTILDYAGAGADLPADGRSLRPLFEDPGREWGREVLIESPNEEGYGIRTPRFKLIRFPAGDVELYDLARDPDEVASLGRDPRYARIRRDLLARLGRLLRCSGKECRRGPALRLRVAYARGAGGCVRSALALRPQGPDVRALERLSYTVSGKRAAAATAAPFAVRVPLSALRPGVSQRLRARASLQDGRVVTLDRTVRRCS